MIFGEFDLLDVGKWVCIIIIIIIIFIIIIITNNKIWVIL